MCQGGDIFVWSCFNATSNCGYVYNSSSCPATLSSNDSKARINAPLRNGNSSLVAGILSIYKKRSHSIVRANRPFLSFFLSFFRSFVREISDFRYFRYFPVCSFSCTNPQRKMVADLAEKASRQIHATNLHGRFRFYITFVSILIYPGGRDPDSTAFNYRSSASRN